MTEPYARNDPVRVLRNAVVGESTEGAKYCFEPDGIARYFDGVEIKCGGIPGSIYADAAQSLVIDDRSYGMQPCLRRGGFPLFIQPWMGQNWPREGTRTGLSPAATAYGHMAVGGQSGTKLVMGLRHSALSSVEVKASPRPRVPANRNSRYRMFELRSTLRGARRKRGGK